MKCVRPSGNLNEKLRLPKNLVLKIFRQLITDLGNEDLASNVIKDIRSGDPIRLLQSSSELEPRRMLKFFDKPSHSHAFFSTYQTSAFLKKYPFKGFNTRDEAIKKFRTGEKTCEIFNRENYKSLLFLNEHHPDYYGIVPEIRKDIERLLGKTPCLERILEGAKHGPGASICSSSMGNCTTEYYKWSNPPYSVTLAALPYAVLAVDSDPRWIGALDNWYRLQNHVPIGAPIDRNKLLQSIFELSDGNKITTVPKTALTDRTIAIEPLLNVFLQLGVDSVFRHRLKTRWNIDINDQTKNQVLAKEGSVSNNYATLDLSNASETVALKICEIFLPDLWYNLLLDLRSPIGNLKDEKISYEKMSSMGNGFTFALETVIFAALTRAAMKRTNSSGEIAVYGDDIVVPSTAAPYLIELLSLSGFALNADKSFISGPFRESCGKDFYLGLDVRPVFLKRHIQYIEDLFYLHNSLFLLQLRMDWRWDIDLSKTIALVYRSIPKIIRHRFYGPVSESLDTHIFSLKSLRRDAKGYPYYDIIVDRPRTFNKGTDFFFRKLMVSLRGPVKLNKWDLKRKPNTGNAFDVTRRQQTTKVVVRHRLPCKGDTSSKTELLSYLNSRS